MKLAQTGNQVTGTFVKWLHLVQGTMTGTVVNNTVTGTWNYGELGSNSSGSFTFTLRTNTGLSYPTFSGTLTPIGSGGSENWCGGQSGQPLYDGCGFSGVWNSVSSVSGATMNLTQIGSEVTGTFAPISTGETTFIQASVTDRRLSGSWSSTLAGSTDKGRLSLWDDGSDAELSGNYYDPNGQGPGNPWCAWRAPGANPGTCSVGGGDKWDGAWFTNFGILNVTQPINVVDQPISAFFYYYYDVGNDQSEQAISSVEDYVSYLYGTFTPLAGPAANQACTMYLYPDTTNGEVDFAPLSYSGWYEDSVGNYNQWCGVSTGDLPSGCGYDNAGWQMAGGPQPTFIVGAFSQQADQMSGQAVPFTAGVASILPSEYVNVSATAASQSAFVNANPYEVDGTWIYYRMTDAGTYVEVTSGPMQWSVDPVSGSSLSGYDDTTTPWCGYTAAGSLPAICQTTGTTGTTGTTTTVSTTTGSTASTTTASTTGTIGPTSTTGTVATTTGVFNTSATAATNATGAPIWPGRQEQGSGEGFTGSEAGYRPTFDGTTGGHAGGR